MKNSALIGMSAMNGIIDPSKVDSDTIFVNGYKIDDGMIDKYIDNMETIMKNILGVDAKLKFDSNDPKEVKKVMIYQAMLKNMLGDTAFTFPAILSKNVDKYADPSMILRVQENIGREAIDHLYSPLPPHVATTVTNFKDESELEDWYEKMTGNKKSFSYPELTEIAQRGMSSAPISEYIQDIDRRLRDEYMKM